MVAYAIVGAAALMLLLWVWMRNGDPRQQLASGLKALGNRDAGQARRRFERAIALVEAGKGKMAEREQVTAGAHLALGGMERENGHLVQAAGHYRAARRHGAKLGAEAVEALAGWFAEKRAASEEAIEVYLDCLGAGRGTGAVVARVEAALESLCEVTEEMEAGQRQRAAELNRRVTVARPDLEWAHYFLGLAGLLDGDAGAAIDWLRTASRLNPARALTFYALARSYTQLSRPALEAAVEALEQFRALAHNDAEMRPRETRVCADVGRLLVESVTEGSEAVDGLKEPGRGRQERAVQYLEVAAEGAPEQASYRYDLGRAYRAGGERERAAEAFRRACELDPREGRYACELGREYAALGRTEAAIEALERALQLLPQLDDAHDALGVIYFQQQEYGKAAEHLQAAAMAGGRNAGRLALWMRAWFKLGEFGRVAEEMDRRKEEGAAFDGDLEAAGAAGRCYSALGRFEEAIFWLQKAGNRPEALYYEGCAHAGLGEYGWALACFESAGDGGWRQKALVQRGHVLRKQGHAEEAKELYRQALAAEGDRAEALRALGEMALMEGALEEAVRQLGGAVAAQPGDCEIRFALGVALERSGRLEEALAEYGAVSEGRRQAAAWLRRGVAHCRLGEYPEALEWFDRSEQAGNASDTGLFYRGLAEAMLGRYGEAIGNWGELERKHPGNERLQLNLARALYAEGARCLAEGRDTVARENWEKYLERYPTDEKVSRDVGELHFRSALEGLRAATARAATTDDVRRAGEHLRAAVRRDPESRTWRLYEALFAARFGGDTEGAVQTMRRLAEEGKDDAVAVYHLGWCLAVAGRAAEAAPLFEAVMGMAAGNGYGRYAAWALGNLMIAAGRLEKATRVLLEAAGHTAAGEGQA